jgi:hypothetical protein
MDSVRAMVADLAGCFVHLVGGFFTDFQSPVQDSIHRSDAYASLAGEICNGYAGHDGFLSAEGALSHALSECCNSPFWAAKHWVALPRQATFH